MTDLLGQVCPLNLVVAVIFFVALDCLHKCDVMLNSVMMKKAVGMAIKMNLLIRLVDGESIVSTRIMSNSTCVSHIS